MMDVIRKSNKLALTLQIALVLMFTEAIKTPVFSLLAKLIVGALVLPLYFLVGAFETLRVEGNEPDYKKLYRELKKK